ncbi:MAG: response regulator transcription factor [Candidatus Nanopelagicales bacterium]
MTGSGDEQIGVLLVDDHTIVRRGLRSYLDTEPGIEVLDEAADGEEALARIAALERGGRLPDVVLMDLQMDGLDGVEATRQLKQRWPVVDVVAVTSFVEEGRIRAVLEAGATGYLLKHADAADVVDAITCPRARGSPRTTTTTCARWATRPRSRCRTAGCSTSRPPRPVSRSASVSRATCTTR